MTSTLLVSLLLGAVVALLLLAVLVVLLRDRARANAALAATREEAEELRRRVDALSTQVHATQRPVEPQEFVITHLGEEDDPGSTTGGPAPTGAQRIDGKLFADLVLRESVVKAAAFGHGVRRALAPETRNRIRFEMKREVKARRKQRKDEVRHLKRALQDQRRARVGGPHQEAAS